MRTPSLRSHLFSLALAVGLGSHAYAQSTDSLVVAPDDLLQKITDYPPAVRQSVLEALQYPTALSDLKEASAHADESFQNLTRTYTDEHRIHLLRLSQCPETIDQLVMVGRQNPGRADIFLQNFSDSAKRQFLFGYNNRYEDLLKLDKIYQSLLTEMFISTEKYPESVQKSFKMIIACPEVMRLLTGQVAETEHLDRQVRSDSLMVYHLRASDNFSASPVDKNVDAYHWNVVRGPVKMQKMNTEMSDAQIQAAFQKKVRTINTIVTIARIGLLIYSSSQSHSHSHRRK